MMKTMIRSHRIGALIATAALALPAAHAQVSLTFDADTQGVVAGADATSVAWDAYGGGCLAFHTTGGWKPNCAFIDLNLPEFAELKAELLEAMTNGGTLSYKITVETDAVAGGAPGWFETMYVGNSGAGGANVWDQTFGGGSGQATLYGAFPLTEARVVEISYGIEAATSAVADQIAQFYPNGEYLQILLGLNSETIEGMTARIYIDDLTITANESPEPLTTPRLTITPARPGLHVISNVNGAYDRQCIRTAEPSYPWVGVATPENPVSYELTLADRPAADGYQCAIYLVADDGDVASTVSNPDWTEPVCAGMWIYRNADGTGWGALRYKDHEANSNGPSGHEYWVADPAPSHGLGGELAGVGSSTVLGTWKVTFTSDTDFTLTSPDGSTNTGAFNAATAAKFADSMFVYFGTIPDQVANIGLSMVFGQVKITGTAATLDENFLVDPYTDALEVAAAAPTGVVQVAPDAARFWLDWTLPATNYQLQQSMDLGDSYPWEEMTMTSAFKLKDGMRRLLRLDEVYDEGVSFFRLEKPAVP